MKKFYLYSIGTGLQNLVLVHGYGFDSKIWFYLIKKLKKYFKIYVLDLPGFGKNYFFPVLKFDQLIELISIYMPPKAIWIGWSLGGIIVNKLALIYPERILSVINVSSTPYFLEEKNWPGIKFSQLLKLSSLLKENYKFCVKDFFQQQIYINKKNINLIYLKKLEKIMLSSLIPSKLALKEGLNVLCSIDLRKKMIEFKVPLLRIYGSLDTMVPKKISNIVDSLCSQSKSIIIEKAAHAPFLTHLQYFCKIIMLFQKSLN
ncbi:pimeloyl-ACP methyl ester esterase BioH [Buchnera aphidicola]|uniref:pimeloyl-ACP methyl ester esterase BioH n=1 Tax=Buchnera aphidicola TaxID=9 RepID=UPI0031B67FAF